MRTLTDVELASLRRDTKIVDILADHREELNRLGATFTLQVAELTDLIAELRDDLHELAAKCQRHQTKRLLEAVEAAPAEPAELVANRGRFGHRGSRA